MVILNPQVALQKMYADCTAAALLLEGLNLGAAVSEFTAGMLVRIPAATTPGIADRFFRLSTASEAIEMEVTAGPSVRVVGDFGVSDDVLLQDPGGTQSFPADDEWEVISFDAISGATTRTTDQIRMYRNGVYLDGDTPDTGATGTMDLSDCDLQIAYQVGQTRRLECHVGALFIATHALNSDAKHISFDKALRGKDAASVRRLFPGDAKFVQFHPAHYPGGRFDGYTVLSGACRELSTLRAFTSVPDSATNVSFKELPSVI